MGFVVNEYSVFNSYQVDDVVYIKDLDRIGVVVDIWYVSVEMIMIAVDSGDTVLLTPLNDPNVIYLDKL